MPDDSSLDRFQDASLLALSLIRDEVQGLFTRHIKDMPEVTPTLRELFWYLSNRSQAVSFLVSHGYAWDAEIILRSFYETAAKILFICFEKEDERANLVDEFRNGLGPINDRKTSRKAAFAEKIFRSDSVSASVFKALQDSRIFELENESSRAKRRALDRKWSFSEMIEALSGKTVNGKKLEDIRGLLHIYGMASHLTHADNAAMDLMWDRANRDPEERKILAASHVCRILTDQVSLSWFCADALRQHFRGTFLDSQKLREAVDQSFNLGKPMTAAFEESQEEFYAKWK